MTPDTWRIALLTPYASSDHVGGVEVFNGHLQHALGEMDTFASPGGSASGRFLNLQRVGADEPVRAYRVARSFLRSHRSRPYQIAITNGLYGWPLSTSRLRIPVIQVYHLTYAALARRALSHRGDRLTARIISASFDRLAGLRKRVIAVSPSVLREVNRHYGLQGEVIPHPVDAALFGRTDRDAARQSLGLPEEGRIGLFVGRAEYVKGFDIFLEVARSMREILFLVAGRDSVDEPNVRSLGEIPHSSMPQVYAAADFLILPSRYEGFGLATLEALASGLPIVVSEAAYPFTEDPSPYGYVATRLDFREFVRGIREVVHEGFSPARTDSILQSHSFGAFRDRWRELVRTMIEEQSPRTA